MYYKLAFRNVRKSYKDFSIYFITLTFSVALFYIFNSFEQQAAILDMSEGQGTMVQALVTIMDVMSVIVAAVFGFLILYANNFLIKRRKKEMGLYTLLGMPRRKISLILILETVYIGFAALLFGLIVGYFGSHLTSLLTARLLAVSANFGFVFSLQATLKTILIFGAVFIIVLIFNRMTLNGYELIDLLRAERKNEEPGAKHLWVSVLVFLLGSGILGGAYVWALQPTQLLLNLLPIIGLGALGTFMIFKSFAGFMLKFMQTNKGHYYKGLNMFVFRQVGAKINSTYRMMATVSLMLLFALGTLITGFNLNAVMAEEIESQTAFDYTLSVHGQNLNKEIDTYMAWFDRPEVEHVSASTIYRGEQTFADLEAIIDTQSETYQRYATMPLGIMSLSDFNSLRTRQGLSSVTLSEHSIALNMQMNGMSGINEQIGDFIHYGVPVSLFNETYTVQDVDRTAVKFENGYFTMPIIIVNDNELLDAINAGHVETKTLLLNADLVSDIDGVAFARSLENNYQHEEDRYAIYNSVAADDIIESSRGMELILTYVSLYLGSVFLVTSVVILALQQLSEASDNQKRYNVLSKIGVSDRMVRHSIFAQNALYFFIPLLIGLIHTYVGVTAVNLNLKLAMMSPTSVKPALMTLGFVLAVYLLYFVVTYVGSKSIILGKNDRNTATE